MTKTILFLCTHNSARSQMAEGLLNHLYGDRFQAYSAGTAPGTLNPFAVQVMAEMGIDISSHHAKHVREFLGRSIDIVVTVCDNAREACPFFPGAKTYLHQGFPDPSAITGTETEKLAVFRTSRDGIRAWLIETFRADQ